MHRKHPSVRHEITNHENQLTIHHERREHRTGQTEPGPESVAVNHRVNQRGRQNGENLVRLRELEPEERREGHGWVAEELRHGESPATKDGEDRAEHVEEPREVEHVGPEEDAAGGACAERETEEPLEGSGGFAPPPEPPRVTDLRGGGEEDSGENSGGENGHEEAVYVWDVA